MNKKTLIIISWLLVAVCMGVIFLFSAQSGDESQLLSDSFKIFFGIPVKISVVRKTAHFLEFAGLAVLVFNAIKQTCGLNRPYLSFFISAAYAVTDEFHQLFVVGRACRLFDIFIDSCGAVTAIAFLMLIFFVIEKRRLYDRK